MCFLRVHLHFTCINSLEISYPVHLITVIVFCCNTETQGAMLTRLDMSKSVSSTLFAPIF